ncbi:carbon starvation protein A [archaeon SCG-AAA382B04]|nr:carbon starvation protein A [archaeon SCG-AAA382B04]
MNGILIALFAIVLFLLAYKFYGTFLAEKIYQLEPDRETPAHTYEDGIEYVPTSKEVVLGHHFTSIAGAAPIVGPALAVIWGWVPALLWIVFGTILIGAVHDFGVLVTSMRNRGRSIGDYIANILSPGARSLMMVVTFFLLALVGSVFAVVIAILFELYPETVIPIWSEMVLAIIAGFAMYKYDVGSYVAGLSALVLMFVTIIIGAYYPVTIPALIGGSVQTTWIVIVLIYGLFASMLPVWTLLQPRDFINAHELYVLLAVFFVGLIATGLGADVVAPAFRSSATSGAPPFYPFLFIVIACGAISGFHSLVASGTTPKQIEKEEDAKAIGYGGMLLEGLLSTAAVIATVVGFTSRDAWLQHYAQWGGAAGLGAKVSGFVEGAAMLVESIGIPEFIGTTFFGVLVVSFAMTTFDTTVRLERYVIGEIGEDYGVPSISDRYIGTVLAIIVIGFLALQSYGGAAAGLTLWPLFGATNQILAGLALLTISVWLYKNKRPTIYTVVPMIFMIITAGSAMLYNLITNWIPNIGQAGNISLVIIGGVVVLCTIGLIYLAIQSFRQA